MSAVVAFGVACVAALAIACNEDGGGGGGSLTLEEYFNELERISANADDELGDIDLPELSPDASFEESRSAFIDFFEPGIDIVDDAVEDVRDVNPPDDAREAHERYADALAETVEIGRSLIDRLEDADEDEFDEILGGDDPFEDIDAAADEACTDLQQIADENNIDVDLMCDE